MKTNKFICLLFLIIIILITNACNTNKPEISFVESSFPLKQKWGFDTGKRINSLAVSNHWVVLGTIDGIVALDSNTGQLLWTSDYLVDPESPIIITEEYLIASNSKQISMVSDIGQHLLTIDLSSNQEDAEVISSYSNYIFILRRPSWILEAYNLVDGSRVWDLSVGPGGLDINFDTLTRIVYITTMESVRALEISSGKLLWEFSQKVITSTYNSGILYFVAETDNPDIKTINAYDVINQKTIWATTFHPKIQTTIFDLSGLDNMLLLSTDFGIISIDIDTGRQLWSSEDRDKVIVSPVEIDGTIYFKGTNSKTIYALSRGNGNTIGNLRLENPSFKNNNIEALSGVKKSGNLLIFVASDIVFAYERK